MVNFTQSLILFGAGWLSCLLALVGGHVLAKPWLDRRLLPTKQGVKPGAIQQSPALSNGAAQSLPATQPISL